MAYTAVEIAEAFKIWDLTYHELVHGGENSRASYLFHGTENVLSSQKFIGLHLSPVLPNSSQTLLLPFFQDAKRPP
jgi:hypothetical protein